MAQKTLIFLSCIPLLALVYSVVFRNRRKRIFCKCVRPGGPCTVVLTGATGGIGQELLIEFLRQDCKVIIGVRNMEKAKRLAEQIRHSYVPHCGELVILWLDLSFMKSVRQFAEQIESQEEHIDILVNNAAVFGASRKMNLTIDGFEEHFQVNYLAPLLLTELLIPLMTKDNHGNIRRIINLTSSLACRVTRPFSLDDINFAESNYSPEEAYARSKYALNLYSVELRRRLSDKGLKVLLIHPGVVITDMHGRRSPNFITFALWRIIGLFLFNSPWRVASLICHTCLCSKGGKEFSDDEAIMYKLDQPERLPRQFIQKKFSKQLDRFSRRVCLLAENSAAICAKAEAI